MKKGVMFFSILFLMLFLTLSINAQEVDLSKKGYKCLKNEIDDKGCSALSLEENIFSLLSTGKCESQLLSSVKTGDCWGSGQSCDTKETAQAIVALQMQNSNVDSYLPWLLAQNKTSNNLDWFVQVDSSSATTCTIDVPTSSYSFDIGENEKLTQTGASPCFSIEEEGYWVKIKSNCYDKEFEVSCNQPFSTTLLFKETISPAIHVLDELQEAPSEGTIIEKIPSLCFKEGTSCDYESSLWATLALDLVDEDVSPYLPYLLALEDQNGDYLPESFLYYLTDDEDFSASLIGKQKGNKYWDEAHDRYYDTAVALFPFSHTTLEEKTNTIAWLEEEQDNAGCWDNKNIVNTAFLLYALWPKANVVQEQQVLCEDVGYCMSDAACVDAEGSELTNYSCFGFGTVCCDTEELEPTCNEMGGTTCSGGEVCDISTQIASDTSVCCVGVCEEEIIETSECENNFGTCKTSCEKGEEQQNLACADSSDACCTPKTKKNLNWLWIVLFIILVLGAVLFLLRKKLFKKKVPEVGKPSRGPPMARRPRMPPRRAPPRRPIPQVQQKPTPAVRPTPKAVKAKEPSRDEILKKLKEMSK